MKNSQATLKMIHRCRLNNMLVRHNNRERERSRIYQIRRELSNGFSDVTSDTTIKEI